jgi:hypothetical protein
MKIERLLAKASKCTTAACAEDLLDMLHRVFGRARPLAHLEQANHEAYMEGAAPFVRFELNRVISGSYITMIRPEIRDGALVLAVVTNRMLDGAGMASQKWELVDDMDDLIECEGHQTVDEISREAKAMAISHHRVLIQQVGVPDKIAIVAARRSW